MTRTPPKTARPTKLRRGPDGRFLRPLKPLDETAQAEDFIAQVLQSVPQVASCGDAYLNSQMRVLIDPAARLEAVMLRARLRNR
jgi:hypothetical protein